jgi:hypothetical protein
VVRYEIFAMEAPIVSGFKFDGLYRVGHSQLGYMTESAANQPIIAAINIRFPLHSNT